MADVKPLTWAGRLKARWKHHLGTVAMVLVVFFGVQAWQTRDFNATIDLATPVQWIGPSGETRNGTLQDAIRAVRPGDGDGAMALYIWAEWCTICTAQQGAINQLTQDWPVLTVAMQSGDANQVRRYQQQRELPWTTVIDARSQLARAQGFRSVPAFAVLDRENRLRFPTVGYTPGWGMRARLWAASLI